ncbi:MAG TPA: NUDIX hydrolase [Candidatus Paceibacterota bacterium]
MEFNPKEGKIISNEKALKKIYEVISADPKSDFAKHAFLKILKLLPPIPNVPGTDIFVELLQKSVSVVVDLVLIRQNKGVYLTPRDDKYFGRGWHFPGGLRAPGASVIADCERIAKRELGSGIHISSAKIIGTEDHHKSPRNHDVTLIVLCEFKGELEGGEWFKEEPKDIIDYHKAYWPMIASYLS